MTSREHPVNPGWMSLAIFVGFQAARSDLKPAVITALLCHWNRCEWQCVRVTERENTPKKKKEKKEKDGEVRRKDDSLCASDG